MADPTWIRARRCSTSACVEVRQFGDFTVVRNSSDPERVMAFTHAEWETFLQGVRDGDFDELGETT